MYFVFVEHIFFGHFLSFSDQLDTFHLVEAFIYKKFMLFYRYTFILQELNCFDDNFCSE